MQDLQSALIRQEVLWNLQPKSTLFITICSKQSTSKRRPTSQPLLNSHQVVVVKRYTAASPISYFRISYFSFFSSEILNTDFLNFSRKKIACVRLSKNSTSGRKQKKGKRKKAKKRNVGLGSKQ